MPLRDGYGRRARRSPPASHDVGRRAPRSGRNAPERPEVAREMRADQILVGHHAIAAQAPARPPRIADDEAALAVVVADRHHAMAAEDALTGLRHWNDSGLRDLLALETFVDRESEHERISFGEASTHVGEIVSDSGVARDDLLQRLRVDRGRRFVFELADVVWPIGLRRSA